MINYNSTPTQVSALPSFGRDDLTQFIEATTQIGQQQRVIATPPAFTALLGGNIIASTLLSQIVYYTAPDQNGNTKMRMLLDRSRYVIVKTVEEWATELGGLTCSSIRSAIALLEDHDLIERETRRRLPDGAPSTCINLNIPAYNEFVKEAIASLEYRRKDAPPLPPDKAPLLATLPGILEYSLPIAETIETSPFSNIEKSKFNIFDFIYIDNYTTYRSGEAPKAVHQTKRLCHEKVGTPHAKANGVHMGSVDVLNQEGGYIGIPNHPDPVATPKQESETKAGDITDLRDSGIGASGDNIPSPEENISTPVLNASVPSIVSPPKMPPKPRQRESMPQVTSKPNIRRPERLMDVLGGVRANGFTHIPTKGAYALHGSLTLQSMQLLILMDCAVSPGIVDWDWSGGEPMINAPLSPCSRGNFETVNEVDLLEMLPMRRLQDAVATDEGESTGALFIFDREWYKEMVQQVWDWWEVQIKKNGRGWAIAQFGQVSRIVKGWLEDEGPTPITDY